MERREAIRLFLTLHQQYRTISTKCNCLPKAFRYTFYQMQRRHSEQLQEGRKQRQ